MDFVDTFWFAWNFASVNLTLTKGYMQIIHDSSTDLDHMNWTTSMKNYSSLRDCKSFLSQTKFTASPTNLPTQLQFNYEQEKEMKKRKLLKSVQLGLRLKSTHFLFHTSLQTIVMDKVRNVFLFSRLNICESLLEKLFHLPLGWNILETNRTVGGLFGYSSENSIRSLNVPAEADMGSGEGRETGRMRERERERERKGSVWGVHTSNFARRIQMWRIEGVRENERNNYMTKNTAGLTRKRS